MTLRHRLTLIVAGIVAVTVVAGAYAAQRSVAGELAGETDAFLVERAARLARAPGLGGAGAEAAPRLPGRFSPDDGSFDLDAVTQFLDADGTPEPAFSGQAELPVDDRDRRLAAAAGRPLLRDVTVDGVPYRMITAHVPRGGAVQIGRATAEARSVLDALGARLAIIAAIAMAAAGLAVWAAVRRLTGPIERLTLVSEHVAATQDLTTPMPVGPDDEVGRLASAFNTMLAALATSREQQKRLVMDASHELRTPLTAIRTNIDLLARAPGLADADRSQLIGETQLELSDLTSLVGELVELAADVRAEEPVVEVDLAQVAEDVVARFRRRSGRDITLSVAPGGSTLRGRPVMLDRALSNLVDNAVKYSPSEAAVDVMVAGGRIEVADRGRGMVAADRERAFDRFFRASGARDRPGSGLGLAIVRQVADLHQGTASVHERDGGGTVARLDLPLVGVPTVGA